jgi:hypothetical protein
MYPNHSHPYTHRRRRAAALVWALFATVLAACDDPADPELPAPVASVEISQAMVQLALGGQQQLEAVLKAADGGTLQGRPIAWSISDTTVAGVSETGLVTGLAAGSTLVTATSEGRSGTAQVIVANPTPELNALSPASATAGDPGFTLTVHGSGFVAESRVTWDGAERPTIFVSASELRAEIEASDIAAPGQAEVRVVNPLPGGGDSNPLAFTRTSPPMGNPVPAIGTVSPNILDYGSPAQTLSIQGTGFMSGSVVRVNGTVRPSEFLGSDALRVTVPASDMATPRTLALTVFNPAPGGGTSDPAFVQVRLCCFDVLYQGTVAGQQELLLLPLGRAVPWTGPGTPICIWSSWPHGPSSG